MIERFRQELDRTLSHRLNPHSGVTVSSNEDDRDVAFLFFQPGLQLQTRHLRHEDVSYQACSLTSQTGFEEFFRGSKAPHLEPSRFHQVPQRITNRVIVIDDGNQLGPRALGLIRLAHHISLPEPHKGVNGMAVILR